MAKINTVRIKSDAFEDGLVINESEYDPEVHELFEAEEAEDPDRPSFDEMTVAQLRAYAEEKELVLEGINAASSKASVISAIKKALEP